MSKKVKRKNTKVLFIKPNGKIKRGVAYHHHPEDNIAIIGFKLKGDYVEYDYLVQDKRWSNDFTDDSLVYKKIKKWIVIFK